MATSKKPEPVLTGIAVGVLSTLAQDGHRVYEAESGSLAGFARTFAPVMASETEPGDFESYIAMGRAWRAGYDFHGTGPLPETAESLMAVGLSDASQKAFERRIASALTLGLFDVGAKRPVSANPSAARSREERKLPEGTVESWTAKAAEAIAAGKLDEAKKASANASRLDSAAKIAARKAVADRTAESKKTLRALVARIIDAPNAEDLIPRAIKALTPIAPPAPAAALPANNSTQAPAKAKPRQRMHAGAK